MSKQEENKLVDMIIDLHQEMIKQFSKVNLAIGELRLSNMKLAEKTDALSIDVNTLKTDVNMLKTDVNTLKTDVNTLKTDVNSLRIDFNKYAQRADDRAERQERRILRLENETFGNAFMAKEPKIPYNKKKRKTK